MIPLYRPTIRRADMRAVLERLAIDSIGPGEHASELSLRTAEYLSKRYGLPLRSHGVALRAAFAALGLESGSRLGVSVLASAAVWNVCLSVGVVPIPIDVQKLVPILPSPLNFDYSDLGLDALLVDSRFGYVPDIDAFSELGFPIIEDVSEGLGGNTGEKKLGSIGDISLVGLEPNNIVTAGGGVVVVAKAKQALASIERFVDPRHGEAALADMNAAMGVIQISQVEQFVERRREIAGRFLQALNRGRHRVRLQGGAEEIVFSVLPVAAETPLRDIESYARTHGVSAMQAFGSSILAELKASDDGSVATFPNAIRLAGTFILFPLYPSLDSKEQETIAKVLATMP